MIALRSDPPYKIILWEGITAYTENIQKWLSAYTNLNNGMKINFIKIKIIN